VAEVEAKTLGRSTLFGGLAELWRIGSRFVLTPLILAKIGLEGYGTWTLLFGLCAYVSMFNTSFTFAFSKFTAEYDKKRDYAGLAEILASGMVLVGGFVLVALSVLWSVRTSVLRLLNVPERLLSDAESALLLVAVCLLVRMSLGGVFQILAGLQRMDLTYKFTMLASLAEFCIALVLLIQGYGLLGLAIAHLCGQLGTIALAWVVCLAICPELRAVRWRFSRAGFRASMSLGGRFQLLSFLVTAGVEGMRILLSALFGPALLGIYELAVKILSLGEAACGAVIAPLMPAFANLYASGDHRRHRVLFQRSTKMVSVISLITFGFLAAFADQIVFLWTAESFPLAAWTIRALVLTEIVVVQTGVATSSLRGAGTVRLETFFALITLCLTFTLPLVAHHWLGYQGIILGLAAARLLAAVWFLHAFLPIEAIGFWSYFKTTLLRPMAYAIPAAAAMILISQLPIFSNGSLAGRWAMLWALAMSGAVSAAISGLLMWYGALSAGERNAIASTVSVRVSPRPSE